MREMASSGKQTMVQNQFGEPTFQWIIPLKRFLVRAGTTNFEVDV